MITKLHTVFERYQTKRLILRSPLKEDVSAVFAIHGEPQTNRFNPHGPMKSLTEAMERLDAWRNNWMNDGFGYWSVLDTQSSEILGFGGIRRMQWADRNVLNLYYRFSTKSWGQGYATEVASTAVELAREYLSEFPVIARISPVNTPSINVAERIGMKRNAEISNSEYSIFTLGW